MSAAQEVVIVRAKRTGVIAGTIAGVLALLGIFTIGIIFVPLAILVAFIGSIVALKNFNIGGFGVNILAWVLIAIGIAVSPGIWVAFAFLATGVQNSVQADAGLSEQIEEGYMITGGARAAVAEYYYDMGRFPANNDDAGLMPAYKINGVYVSSVLILDGNIFVAFGDQAAPLVADSRLWLKPDLVDGKIVWGCYSDLEQSLLPRTCISEG